MKTNSSLTIIFQLLILVLFFIVLPIFFLVLRVDNIDCKLLSDEACPEILQKSIDDLHKSPLITTDFEEVISKKSMPAGFILTRVSKKLPNTLNMVFQSEVALFKISCSDCQDQLIVGEHQHILPQSNNLAEIPVFNLPKSQHELVEGDLLKLDFYQPLKRLTESLYKNQVIFQNGEWISEEEIRIFVTDLPVVIFSSDNIENQSTALGLLLKNNSVKQTGVEIKEIDLRFNMPVLRTRQ